MRNRIIFLFFVFATLPAPLASAGTVSLDLEEAVALALRDNKDILIGAQEVNKAKARIAEARAGFLPTVTFNGGLQYTINQFAENIKSTDINLSFKQYLYRGGRIVHTLKYSQNGLEIAEAVLDSARLEKVHLTRQAYYALLLARDYAGLNRRILDNTERHFRFLGERYDNGQASASDILEVKAALKEVRREYVASLNQIEALQMSFRTLLALDLSVRVVPQGVLSHKIEDVAYDKVFLKAMSQRPEFRQYDAQVRAQRSAIEIAKSEGRPSITAGWNYYTSSTSQFAGGALPRHGWQDYSIAGITLNWPMFDGGVTRAKVQQAIADLKEAELMREKAVYDVASDLKNAYLSLKDSLARIEASRADMVRYMDNLTVTEKRYAQGIRSHLDLEDANLQMEVASFNSALALYDYWTARSLLDRAQGESYV